MNLPVLCVVVIMLIAPIGHINIGPQETARLGPLGTISKPMANWGQTICAFRMLSIDLLLVVLLFALAVTDKVPAAPIITFGLAIYFATQAILWLGHTLWLQRGGVTWISLPHWGLWTLCTGLLFGGA